MIEFPQNKISIRGIADQTGMCPHDVASTLQRLGMLERDPEMFPHTFEFSAWKAIVNV